MDRKAIVEKIVISEANEKLLKSQAITFEEEVENIEEEMKAAKVSKKHRLE